jgi:hypothetical protein
MGRSSLTIPAANRECAGDGATYRDQRQPVHDDAHLERQICNQLWYLEATGSQPVMALTDERWLCDDGRG